MAEALRVLLLGPPALTLGGSPYALKRRGVRALLYYLACRTDPVARDEMLSLFWGDEPESEARQKLRVTLSRLRAELPDPACLRIENSQIYLDPACCSCDVRDFEALYEEINRASVQIPALSPFPESIQRRMVQAVELWRGSHFLVGGDLGSSLGLDDWTTQTRQRLEWQRQRIFELLANHAIATGAPEAGADWLRRALENDPASDLLHLRLVNLLERQGRPGDALAHLQNARAAYEREGFDGLPAELETALERLRRAAGKKPAVPLFSSSLRPILMLPFIGRRVELESLQAAHRRRQLNVILGEAGSGKSRLVQEFYASLSPAPRLLICTSRVFGSGMPFQPVIEMLRGQVAAEDWRKLSHPWISALAILLPELEAILPVVPAASQMGIDQSVLFEALHQLFKSLAEEKGLLVVLDDAQWYDETSLAAFAFSCGQDLFYNQAGLIVCSRQVDQPEAFQAFLHQVSVMRSVNRVTLSALGEDEIAEMVRVVFGRQPPPKLVASLSRDTGGNLLFLIETLRGLIDYSLDPFEIDPNHLPLAGSVHAMMRERLQKISPFGQAVLVQAAVIGNNFPVALLEKVIARPGEQVSEALAEMENARLIASSESRISGGEYHFVHEKLREVLLMELTPLRRRLLHLHVAEAIQEQQAGPPDARAGLIADHYEAAGEDRRAFDSWLAAASYARRLYSITEAQSSYQRASQILSRLTEQIEDVQVLRLYKEWTEFCFDTADRATLDQAGQSMLAAGYRRQNVELIRGGFLALAAVADLADQPADGLVLLDQALPFLEMQPAAAPQEWLHYYYRRGGFMGTLNRISESIADLRRAVELVPQALEPRVVEMRANCGYRLGVAYLYHGELAASLESIERSMADSRAAMSHPGAARAMVGLGLVHFYLGNFDQADEYNRLSLRMIAPMHNQRLGGTLYAQMAEAQAHRGRFDECWKNSGMALEAAQANGFTRVVAQAASVRAGVLFALEDYQGAEALYQKSLDASRSLYTTLESMYRLGLVWVRMGKAEEGLETIERALSLCAEYKIGLYRPYAECTRAIALLALDRCSEAVSLVKEIAVQSAEHGPVSLHCLASLVLGRAALQEGRNEAACRQGLEVAREAREMGGVMIELSGLTLALKAAPSTIGINDRLHELLAQIDAQTRDSFLRPRFEQFKAQLTNL